MSAPSPVPYDEALARHYDDDYAVLRHDGADIAFYRGLADEAAGPVLEMACGTGRVLLPVARDGHAVTGVDPSPTMLERLRAKLADEPPALRERVRLADGHFEDAGVAGPFALVFSAFRAFQHLETRERQLAGLREMRRLLAPGGRLAFDTFDFCPERAAARVEEQPDYTLQIGDQRHQRWSRAEHDAERRLMRCRFRWLVDGVEVDVATFTMTIVSRDEIVSLLAEANLELEALFGDFDRSAWTPHDPRELVVVARRPERDA